MANNIKKCSINGTVYQVKNATWHKSGFNKTTMIDSSNNSAGFTKEGMGGKITITFLSTSRSFDEDTIRDLEDAEITLTTFDGVVITGSSMNPNDGGDAEIDPTSGELAIAFNGDVN